MTGTVAAPVGDRERIDDLDILRGAALFGVFLVNMAEFARDGVLATEAQMAALPTASLDAWLFLGVEWLFGDKANTIFAFLFGLGFAIQMERGGDGFAGRFVRRLGVLFGFGLIHLFLVWTWDILHLYALAGLALFALRGLSQRAVLGLGLALACVDPHLVDLVLRTIWPALDVGAAMYEAPATLARQAAVLSTDYPAMVAAFARLTWVDYILNASLASWLAYALGRHLLGFWAGRAQLIQRADRHLPLFRRIAWFCVPIGLVAALLVREMAGGAFGDAWETPGECLRAPAAAVLAAGYVAALLLARRTALGGRLLAPLAPVGRMALSNYVTQSLVFGLVWSGFGLGLAGRTGTGMLILIVIAGYALQVAISGWWLARYRFGPLEWLWRTLTYGRAQPMRRGQ